MYFYKGLLLLSDIVLVNFAFFLALLLRFDFNPPAQYTDLFLHQWFVLTLIHLCIGLIFKLYKCLLRYVSTREIVYLVGATIISGITFFIYGATTSSLFPRTVYAIYLCVLILLMVFSRLSYKIMDQLTRKSTNSLSQFKSRLKGISATRVMVIGAGDAGAMIVRDIKKGTTSKRKVILAVDDDKSKMLSYLSGVPIKGPINQLEIFAEEYDIDEIIIALPSASQKRISEILKICNNTRCTLKIFPGMHESLREDFSLNQLRSVQIEDLLGRDVIKLNNPSVRAKLTKRTVLVTGGGGSIGSELCRQIAAYEPSTLVLLDIYENNVYDIQNELLRNGIPPETLHVLIGSVRDAEKLSEIFEKYKPDIVFHAAAHKHVPLMEVSPSEAIKNNVFGTLNVAKCAKKYKAQKFILISTDKAVNPTNVMGATKRICEMIIQSINATTPDTDYVAVRFGNVLGSNGSVIPLFKRQLEAGGPLTVTHPDIIRYFMTIPEAVSLILQTMTLAQGGEIFILDMGEPVKILDLATNFIKLSGLKPYDDIDIIFTGLRPGEKLYEELLMSEEGLTKTSSDQIFIGNPTHLEFDSLVESFEILKPVLNDQEKLREAIMQIVPTYHPASH
ncbi:MAG: polysaccharide biosynthesis protein [Cellulosilyticaceae bacterium]